MSLAVPAQAEDLLKRLARIAATYREPSGNAAAVERALQEHLRRLGVDGLTIKVATDLAGSRRVAMNAALEADSWLTTWRAAWRAARRDAWCAAPWRAVRRLTEVSARRVIAVASWRQLRQTLSASENLAIDGPHLGAFASVLDWLSDQTLFDALDAVVELAAWCAEPDRSRPIDRWIEVLSPLVDAFEAGLWLCWVTSAEVCAVLRPPVSFAGRPLHTGTEPAVVPPRGSSYASHGGVPEMVIFETLHQLEHQCLGLDVPCSHGFEPLRCADSAWRATEDVEHIQYEITGAAGGVWHLVIGLDDCELREGASTDAHPFIVRTSTEDWLRMWSGSESASALIQSGRLSLGRAGMTTALTTDLSFLGALGPLREPDNREMVSTTYPYTEDGEANRCVLRDAYPDALDHVRGTKLLPWRNEQNISEARQSPRAFRRLLELGLIARKYYG